MKGLTMLGLHGWESKARIQRAVAALPAADAIYYGVQRAIGSLRPGRHDPRGWFSAAARMAGWITESGRKVADATFLEVGTGRTVDLPMGLWLCGAARVLTVDVNAYLSAALTRESVTFVRARPHDVLACFGDVARTPRFEERFTRLRDFDGDLADLLRMMNVEYRAQADAGRLALAAGSIDYHVSYAVLEHVPSATIAAILAEARRILAQGGVLLHVIDPSDHFSHDDASITTVNFLRFSDTEWTRIAGNKFVYHNRLRAHEHLAFFAEAGARVLRQQQNLDARALAALRDGFPLHPSFAGTEVEKLAVRGITLMADFPT